MRFPQANHKPTKEAVPRTIEGNAKALEEYLEKVNWKQFARRYWIVVASLIGTIMLFIIGIGIANKLVSIL